MNFRTTLWPLGLCLLAACAMPATAGSGPAHPQAGNKSGARVTGTVGYLQRIAPPPAAVVKVQLIEVSRADAAATVLGEQLIQAEGRQPPFAFAIDYGASLIQPHMSLRLPWRLS